MNCLPLGVGPIILKNHAGPKEVSYNALLSVYIADQTEHGSLEAQYKALKEQLVNLSNVYNNQRSNWVMVEKNAGGYISQLQMNKGN